MIIYFVILIDLLTIHSREDVRLLGGVYEYMVVLDAARFNSVFQTKSILIRSRATHSAI